MATSTQMIHMYLLIFGACIGSFLNVCIFRLPAGKSIIHPGSCCPSCDTPIPPYHNIPLISYLILQGRCHRCRTAISLRYPLVELLTALICLLIFKRYGLSVDALAWFILAAVLIVVSFIDIDLQIIPDRITLPGIPLFGALAFWILNLPVVTIVSGCILGGGILYTVAFAYYKLKGIQGMGGGDIKLLAMIGAMTGPQGVLFTLFCGSLLGTLGGVIAMILSSSSGLKLKIPFGPYLSAGALLYGLYGDGIIFWYVSMIS